ncbi:hypothetical protein [Globicatella sp. PHS-GS-PNBC-21-1553]|uniref:hypothetical protein n=1 Tax=Globicatella sp. PHS-GS-PNBC-21-1553 TaxID=2885764 RepID=UPI00298EF04B|nr:hypothetical protein [Globicatella sp. PHS-GS-PNBC-21-1553]WPC08782.1 hypothetical protein LB888_00555 [Globicatella sp. PHS-GS-PNBC-21-1553]
MNYLQLQLLDYAFFTITQNSKFDYKLVIKSSDDVFEAKTFTKNDYGTIEWKIYSPNSHSTYIEKYTNFEDGNPFYEIRRYIYNVILKNYGQNNDRVIHFPEIYFNEMIEFIQQMEINHEFEMPEIFYNYQSLINKEINLKFVKSFENEYTPLSVVFNEI